MQQQVNPKTPPAYLEKITLYFTPDNWIVIMMGNQRYHASADEVKRLIDNHLLQHAKDAALFNGEVDNAQV
jgi:hypothetical protein